MPAVLYKRREAGAPWGTVRGQESRWTKLTFWLLRLGIRVSHSRPHHPQTQGKDERFHSTLNLELLRGRALCAFFHTQAAAPC